MCCTPVPLLRATSNETKLFITAKLKSVEQSLNSEWVESCSNVLLFLRLAPATEALVGHHELVDDRDVVPPAVLHLVDAVVGCPAGVGPAFALAYVFFSLEWD